MGQPRLPPLADDPARLPTDPSPQAIRRLAERLRARWDPERLAEQELADRHVEVALVRTAELFEW